MADSFKAENKNPAFVNSLFLLFRILMIRLGNKKLEEVIKRLWPHLLAELVSVFDKSKVYMDRSDMGQTIEEENYQTTKEAIKVVELMSQLNIEEFQMNQWMFIFDGFGIHHQSQPPAASRVQRDFFSPETNIVECSDIF